MDTTRVSWGGDMNGPELYREYRRLIEKLADERRPSEASLTALRANCFSNFKHSRSAGSFQRCVFV